MNAIQHADKMIASGKYKETNGPNRSPAIDLLEDEFGIPRGNSWCALFVSKAFKLAAKDGGKGKTFPYSASSQALLEWFKNHGEVSTDAQDLLKWKGAIVVRTNHPDVSHGHVALVRERLTNKSGKVIAIVTDEGNSNLSGSANGDGAYEEKRKIPLTGDWHFCRTDSLVGGSWW